ncbi:putative bifunctional diguanylate cyclase/phosphodiesterase [Paraburkholderia caballeronis]|uniref:putative bifunctional diguanylate cyclase/phosphodiesterase n=1 Tax=Paraburkholderia caballeronis TaxID=416943 RepID=UPI001064768C|nr:GGDEF and EAL domain-containing protein [Paraburkholderia caballeronis]TDV15632.1 PAS domain S-box-containing protein/diguanylate cyclase (GGDEF)-like protein [Paraburkholderia caballeronis]TDV17887.1 PAS domain S-box-containing protein/diguanylate cyclase (GGDEF)-like protein [Paraburkholderia caballeronis]TDV26499.1 PAS domain S-box-containing protein/diguanylate cyclase (GGDEF)-like protein [Paraburkholderia caballeronis]
MKCPPALPMETERLAALAEYGLGSDRPLPSLDVVVRIAAHMFEVPVAAVNMVGDDHVFFAAATGFAGDGVDMSRDASFCAHAILQDGVMVVPDATLDDRFHDNPLVTGDTQVRFYAGVPLLSAAGHALGALCVIDTKAHHDFSADDRERLRELARMAADRMELRRVELFIERDRRPFAEPERRSPTAMIRFDEHGTILDWNDAAAMLYGYAVADGPDLTLELLAPERDRAGLRDLIARAVAAGSVDGMTMPPEVHGLRRDGTEFLLGFSLFCWRENGVLTFNAHLQDLSALRDEKDALKRLAGADVLTGVANRISFYRNAEAALTCPLGAAVVILDLDGFKDVNDTLGHAVGDGILCDVARRLTALARPDDTVARIGADEFALLLRGVTDTADARRFADAAAAAIAEPMVVGGFDVRVTACCGVAVAPQHAQEALSLIGNADLALSRAKHNGPGQAFVFVAALRMEAVARRVYNIELHRAVSDGEFVLFYQPQVDFADGSLTGAEALIRWRHPQRGLLSPAAFLPALERGPLAPTVGAWILDEACEQAAFWRRNGAPGFRMGVNLFGAQFRVGNIVDEVIAVLDRHGLPPQALELEVTENIVLDDDAVLDSLQRLHEYGVGIAFDDFGTGYASISLLRRYPLSRIKIDRSFVQGMVQSGRDASLVRALVDMARSFDLRTIAEGVETVPQCDGLRQLGCDEGQGYLFGVPMPAREFGERFDIGLGDEWVGWNVNRA